VVFNDEKYGNPEEGKYDYIVSTFCKQMMDSKYNLVGGNVFPKFPMKKSATVVNFSSSTKKPRLDQRTAEVTQPGPGTLLQQRKSLPVYGVRNRHVNFSCL
jgi:hypothetical protein